jgi:hypothetical protein
VTTPTPADPTRTAEAIFARSWALFRKNWILAVPPVITGVITVVAVFPLLWLIADAVFAHVGDAAKVTTVPAATLPATFLPLTAFVGVVLVAVTLWCYAMMYGMADAAWARGTTSLGDGFAAFRRRAGALFVAGIGALGVAFAALILALPTLGLAVIALPVVTMYIMPSAVAGRRSGFAAVGESFRLVRRSLGRSALVMLCLYAIMYGISLVGGLALFPVQLAVIPSGPDATLQPPPLALMVVCGGVYLVFMLASMAFKGFYALVIAGLYRSLAAGSADHVEAAL